MKVEDKSEKTIKSYVRAVDRLVRFHRLTHPKELDIHEVLDFLVSLTEHQKVNWSFLAPRFKARNLKSIRKHLKVCPPEVIKYKNTPEFLTATTGIDPHLGPKCHKGEMIISPPIRLRFLHFDVTYGHRLFKSRDQSVFKNKRITISRSRCKNIYKTNSSI